MKNFPLYVLLVLSVLLFQASCNTAASPKRSQKTMLAQVTYVIDGDTFNAKTKTDKFKVRIVGLDAPEGKQAFGDQATQELTKIIFNKTVNLKTIVPAKDIYGRTLAHVYLGEKDIALSLIQKGLATYYRPYCRDYPHDKSKYNYDPADYVEAEKIARSKKLGMWGSGDVMLPCEFRKKNN